MSPKKSTVAGKRGGVLPLQELRKLVEAGFFEGVSEKYLNPASVDLPLSEEAYRLETVFRPHTGERVRALLRRSGALLHDLKNPLEIGVPYLIRLGERFKLPKGLCGYVNPKSSTGRVNLLCRTIADGVAMYDSVTPEKFDGEIWVIARAGSFPILLSPGQAVSQLRLFDRKVFLTGEELQKESRRGLIFSSASRRMPFSRLNLHADSIFLTLEVDGRKTGFECRGVNKILDFGKIGAYDGRDFFTLPEVRGDSVVLRKGSFYILSTRERVMVSPHLSAELRATDEILGEFRSHAAGYIDPGWGFGKAGERKGRPITLEVVPHEDMLVRRGEVVVRLRYEWMREVPEVFYDQAKSNYTSQKGPKLSKHFKGW